MGSAPQGHPLPPFVRSPPPIPRLLQTPGARRANLRARQLTISRTVFCLCLLLPPMWLLYGIGLLDDFVFWWTEGEVEAMDEGYKHEAWAWGLFSLLLGSMGTAVYLFNLLLGV